MANRDDHNYSEDMFADTRMTFGEHLEDLRLHLWRAIAGFIICVIGSFFVGKPVLQFIAQPVSIQLEEYYDKRVKQVQKDLLEGERSMQVVNQPKEVVIALDRAQLMKELGVKPPDEPPADVWIRLHAMINPLDIAIVLQEAERVVGRRPYLSTLSVQEAFMAYFKVCLMCGLVLGSPWIFYQIWLFVAAGLYPHERKYVHVYLPMSICLFLCGVFICQFFVLPKAIQALLWFNEWIGLEPDIRFTEWLGFAILMPLVFGVSFQLPLVMLFMERIGIMDVSAYWAKWKIALFLIHVFAAVITPSIDPFSMEFLALPMFALYLLGIFLCQLNPRDPGLNPDAPDPEEAVEV